MQLSPPPERLVVNGAVTRWGMFAGAIHDPNLADASVYGPLGGLRFKQWQHLVVMHPEVALSFAVVDAGLQRLAWIQAIDRTTGTRSAWETQALRLHVGVARSLFDGRTWAHTDTLTIDVHNHLDADEHTVHLAAPDLQADLTCHATVTPLVVCLPVGRGRAMYSHKVPLPTEGRITWSGRTLDLDPNHTTSIFDIHKAHYPHHTWWHWATFAGRTTDGRSLAVNLTRNLIDDPRFHENAMWLDGDLTLLPVPTFQVDDDPWTARSDEVDLRFAGDGERREDLDILGLVRSRFRQRYGRWSGTVAGHRIDDAWGLAENHDSRW